MARSVAKILSKIIRHHRILVVREMVLKGYDKDTIISNIIKMGVNLDTANSYLDEVRLDIARIMIKQGKLKK